MRNEKRSGDFEVVIITPDGVQELRVKHGSDNKPRTDKARDNEVQRSEGVAKSVKVGSGVPESIKEYYNSRKQMIDDYIKSLAEKSPLPKSAFSTALGGKRLRGVLVMLVAESLGASPEDALKAATAVELAHATSLDLDDIVDRDVVRRGRPARWVREGILKVVLSGYGLLGLAGNLISDYGPQAVKEWFDTWVEMVVGEARDVLGGNAYEAIISAKTATLWGLAASLGAIVAHRNDKAQIARSYGRAIGMAYQIADDICDVIRASEDERLPSSLSAKMFMLYLGIHGGFDREKAEEKALEKLDYWIALAEKQAERLTTNKKFLKLLKDYPGFAARQMLDKCM